MHSHVLTDSIRTGGTHLISTSCSARGSVYKCSTALIRYWLQIRKCPGVLTEINSEPLRHSDPLQRCLFSRCFTKRLESQSLITAFTLHTGVTRKRKPKVWPCCFHAFWSGIKEIQILFFGGGQELKLALGLLFVNEYYNVGFSITGINRRL